MFTSEAREVRHRDRCRRASTPRRWTSSPSRRGQSRRHPLLAGRAEEHRRAGGGEPGRRAHAPRGRFTRPLRFRRRAATRRRSTSARWRRWPPPAPSTRFEPQPRAGARQRRADPGASPTAPPTNAAQGTERPVRRRRRSAATAAWTCAPVQGVDADGAAAARVRRGRLLPLRPSARCLRRRARQARRRHLRRAGGARRPRRRGGPPRRRRRLRRASGARRRATSSPSPCSPSRPASSRR